MKTAKSLDLTIGGCAILSGVHGAKGLALLNPSDALVLVDAVVPCSPDFGGVTGVEAADEVEVADEVDDVDVVGLVFRLRKMVLESHAIARRLCG